MNRLLLSIFDYREILRRELSWRSQRNPSYSQRAFARDLAIAPHRFSEVLRGKQGLSLPIAQAMAEKLGFGQEESKHFCDLVESQHARSPMRRRAAMRRVSQAKQSQSMTAVAVDQFELIGAWYHLALLEWMKTVPKNFDGSQAANALGIRLSEVTQALERLVRLGFLKKLKTKYQLIRHNNTVTGGIPSESVKLFHEANLEKAKAAIFSQTLAERHFSTSYVAISESFVDEAKQLIEAFWQDFHAAAERHEATSPIDRVYTLGVQFYRTTSLQKSDSKKKDTR